MFELTVALKYLIPRWRQLSVSIISIISILVIALVVWLIVVFFSVTNGLHLAWTEKLITLTAPIRVTPTDEYYNSYYYLSDQLSSEANYTQKSVGEKLIAEQAVSYNPEYDEEIPDDWPQAIKDSNGEVKDLVKAAYSSLNAIDQVQVQPYEVAAANANLSLIRNGSPLYLTQAVYTGSLDHNHPTLKRALLKITRDDLNNLKALASNMYPQDAENGTPAEYWIQGALPHHLVAGDGVLLPKTFREAGVLIGDRGSLSYQAATATSVQEQTLPIFVAGFYDPGIFPMGGKFLLTNEEVVSVIRGGQPHNSRSQSNGFNVRFTDLDSADHIKANIVAAMEKEGIAPYWNVQTYKEYDFTKDLLQQLQSEKNLFSLIATVIIIVACSNIISMLIILVNDKKMEIGILRSMGATSQNIATIFGLCGFTMGVIGSIIGMVAAVITLQNLQELVDLISWMQGFEAFNPIFFGEALPNTISFEAITFVMGVTAALSLLAGIVPAVKASMLRPATILRSE